MIIESEHFVGFFVVVGVNSDDAGDLTEGENVGVWRELNVHDVFFEEDVWWFKHTFGLVAHELKVVFFFRER